MSDQDVSNFPWNLQREGRSWTREEWERRRELTPEKIELIRGKLFWSEEDRLNMLALLLENVGVDRAIRLGDRRVWQEAIGGLDGLDRAPSNADR
jgi:hypothetical protein